VVFIDSGGQWWRPAPEVPAQIDLTVPSPARMYDYYLGWLLSRPGGTWRGQTAIFWSAPSPT